MFGKAMIKNSGTVKIFLLSTMVILLVSSNPIDAQVPNTISYQGLLADGDGDVVDDGDYNLHFKIWDDITDGTMLWEENHIGVQVQGGRFHVILGSLESIAFDQPYWVGISVQGGAELPRFELTSAGYSLNARSIVDNAITSAKIQDGTIQFADIGENGANTNQIMKWNGSTWSPTQDETGDGVTDHGDLTGLEDNDHPQYLHKNFPDSTQTVLGKLVFGNTGTEKYLRIDEASPYGNFLDLFAEDWNTSQDKKGLRIYVNQDGGGGITGIHSDVWHDNGGMAWGIRAEATSPGGTAYGVRGLASSSGSGTRAIGVYGKAEHAGESIGIYGRASGGVESTWAGVFDGDIDVYGDVHKDGGGFKIDHPLNPSNKYLQHSFVESPDRMNIYNGITKLDGNGRATIELPEYFEALNKDFRYQLTCIGGYAPVFISDEVSGNRFSIAGGDPYMKVSWQITGIRKDKWAEANPLQEIVEKNSFERGYYRHPELYGFGVERHIDHDLLTEMEEESKAAK